MKRIYFLVPNINIAKNFVDSLLLARVDEHHIHVLAKRGTPLDDLPAASFLQKTDFIPALEQGLVLGGLTGILAGILAVALPSGMVLGGGTVLAITLTGAGFGALMSSMVGSSIGNRRIQKFQQAMENGEFLMMVDVPRSRVEEIEQRVKQRHPEAESEGTEPTIPAFP